MEGGTDAEAKVRANARPHRAIRTLRGSRAGIVPSPATNNIAGGGSCTRESMAAIRCTTRDLNLHAVSRYASKHGPNSGDPCFSEEEEEQEKRRRKRGRKMRLRAPYIQTKGPPLAPTTKSIPSAQKVQTTCKLDDDVGRGRVQSILDRLASLYPTLRVLASMLSTWSR